MENRQISQGPQELPQRQSPPEVEGNSDFRRKTPADAAFFCRENPIDS